jgi:hypothetical protein
MAVKAPKVVASKFKGTTHVTFVLDRSGSMLKIKDQVIDGFNDWLSSLALAAKGAGGGFPVTVVLFNTTVDVPVDGVSVGDVNPLDSTRYVCRGNTALNDALVESIFSTGDRMKDGDRALVCVFTDGRENASKEYSTDQTRDIIREKEAEGNWTFTYLSASPSAFLDAQSYGVRAGNTMSFAGDARGTTSAFSGMSGSTQRYAMGAQAAEEQFYVGDIPVVVDGPVPAGEVLMQNLDYTTTMTAQSWRYETGRYDTGFFDTRGVIESERNQAAGPRVDEVQEGNERSAIRPAPEVRKNSTHRLHPEDGG